MTSSHSQWAAQTFSHGRPASLCTYSHLDDLPDHSHKLTDCSGEDLRKLFKYAQEKGFAIPAINVTSSSTVVSSLEAARDAKSPVILQVSQGGAAYFAGKGTFNSQRLDISQAELTILGVGNSKQEASIGGSVAAAHYIRAVAPLYNVPVILHTVRGAVDDLLECMTLTVIGSLREKIAPLVRWNGRRVQVLFDQETKIH